MMTIRKLDALLSPGEAPFAYANTFDREAAGDQNRLRIGVDQAQDRCVGELARVLIGPFQLLYVLHTTRTAAELGRYESPVVSAEQAREFLRQFGTFLSED